MNAFGPVLIGLGSLLSACASAPRTLESRRLLGPCHVMSVIQGSTLQLQVDRTPQPHWVAGLFVAQIQMDVLQTPTVSHVSVMDSLHPGTSVDDLLLKKAQRWEPAAHLLSFTLLPHQRSVQLLDSAQLRWSELRCAAYEPTAEDLALRPSEDLIAAAVEDQGRGSHNAFDQSDTARPIAAWARRTASNMRAGFSG